MIEVILLFWILVACMASFIYVLNDGRLVRGGWNGEISPFEVMLVLLCLPVISITACLWGVVWSVYELYEKSGLGKIMTKKFKIGR